MIDAAGGMVVPEAEGVAAFFWRLATAAVLLSLELPPLLPPPHAESAKAPVLAISMERKRRRGTGVFDETVSEV
jgi:hypothetical protein